MSSAPSSPRGGDSASNANPPAKSPSIQSQTNRYSPYPQVSMANIRQGVPAGMMAVANNGQVIMANQVQIANPAALQARLASPYGQSYGQVLGGGHMLMAGGAMGQMAGMIQQPMMTAMPMMNGMGGMGMVMPQMMQYVQPSAQMANPANVGYQAAAVSYQNTPNVHPPPPPAGNPPKDGDQNSRSSSPTPAKLETSNPVGSADYDYNERLKMSNQEHRLEIQKLLKENQKFREKVKKLSREHTQATRSYTVKDGKCPFCLQEMPTNKSKK